MGKTNSKPVNNSGDPQFLIQNQLETHAEMHESHDLKLTVIMVIVCLQLAITVYVMYKKHSRREALKVAKSVASLQV